MHSLTDDLCAVCDTDFPGSLNSCEPEKSILHNKYLNHD